MFTFILAVYQIEVKPILENNSKKYAHKQCPQNRTQVR